jgi:hypothetical protein
MNFTDYDPYDAESERQRYEDSLDYERQWMPRDPDKPLTRATRRVLVFLTYGGCLKRQQRVLSGRKVRIPDPDPRNHYWILVAPKPRHAPGKPMWKAGRPEYRLTKETIAGLVAKGYLRGISEGEAGEDNVTARGRDIVSRTDWNGNWLEGRKP